MDAIAGFGRMHNMEPYLDRKFVNIAQNARTARADGSGSLSNRARAAVNWKYAQKFCKIALHICAKR